MRSDGRGRRVVRWYIAVALTLTAFGGILHWLVAPPIGLVRTVYADIGIAGEPLFEVRTTDISLAFLDEDPTLPRRFFSVEWRGFWFLPRAQTVDVYAGGDDRVDVLVDDQLVLRRNFSVGTHTTSETITLGAGSHEIIVRYEQEGGSASLNIQRAIDGKSQRTFLPTRLFSVRPNVQGFLLAAGSYWLTRLVAVLWLGPIAWLFLVALGRAGRPVVHRWRTVGAPRTAGNFCVVSNFWLVPHYSVRLCSSCSAHTPATASIAASSIPYFQTSPGRGLQWRSAGVGRFCWASAASSACCQTV